MLEGLTHQDLGLSTFVVGLVTGSQFVALGALAGWKGLGSVFLASAGRRRRLATSRFIANGHVQIPKRIGKSSCSLSS
jgi:hypothetical protein